MKSYKTNKKSSESDSKNSLYSYNIAHLQVCQKYELGKKLGKL